MFRFSIRAALGLMFLVAMICTVLFAVPTHLFLAIIFVGVMALPATLISGVWHRRRFFRIFTRGALVAYSVWFVIVGIPGGFQAMRTFADYTGVPFSGGIGTSFTGPSKGMMAVPSYLLWAGLYAPWFVVLFGGAFAVLVDLILDDLTPTGSSEP